MISNNNETVPKMLMKDLFKLRQKHNNDKVDFNIQTVDRKCGDFSIVIKYDDKEFKSSDDLYNYMVSQDKGIRFYFDNKDFRELELNVISNNRITFNLNWNTFELEVIKEVI